MKKIALLGAVALALTALAVACRPQMRGVPVDGGPDVVEPEPQGEPSDAGEVAPPPQPGVSYTFTPEQVALMQMCFARKLGSSFPYAQPVGDAGGALGAQAGGPPSTYPNPLLFGVFDGAPGPIGTCIGNYDAGGVGTIGWIVAGDGGGLAFVAGPDLQGTAAAQIVVQISGDGGVLNVLPGAQNINFAAAASPSISQSPTTAAQGADLLLAPQWSSAADGGGGVTRRDDRRAPMAERRGRVR